MHFQYSPHLEKTLNIVVLEYIIWSLSLISSEIILSRVLNPLPSGFFSFAFIPFFIHILPDFFVSIHDIRDHAFKARLRLYTDRQEITLCLFLSCFQQTEVSPTFLITTKYGIFNPSNSYTALGSLVPSHSSLSIQNIINPSSTRSEKRMILYLLWLAFS